jgi:choline kinase
MNVVILAAGKGTRLCSTDHLPKPLTSLENGQTLLGRQLECLAEFVPLSSVIVVVGYHKEAIMERYPELLYVVNPQFESENTSKSLLKALRHCQGDVLWLNGDVVFHPSVIDAALATRDTAMVVNAGPVGDEEVKYRADDHGYIVEVSKRVEDADGEALGINYVSESDLPLLADELEKCAANDYFEKGIEGCIARGMHVRSVVVGRDDCTEVDFPEDLQRANTLLQGW